MAGDTMVIRGQTYDGWMAEIANLRELVDRWKRHASHLRGELIEAQRKLLHSVDVGEARRLWQNWKDAWGTGDSEEAYALMEMDIFLGVDERGNVLEQDSEPQASDEQAGLEVDLPQDQKDDVEQQDDKREERPNPRARKRVSRHVLHQTS